MTNEIATTPKVYLMDHSLIESAQTKGDLSKAPQKVFQKTLLQLLSDMVIESIEDYGSYTLADTVVHSYVREFTNGGSDYAKASKVSVISCLSTVLSKEQWELLKEEPKTAELVKSTSGTSKVTGLGIKRVA